MNEVSRSSEWARGWPLVVAGALGMGLCSIHAGPISVLMLPLASTFGWSRAEISASILIISMTVLTLGPFMGGVFDRFGIRRMGLIGIAGFSVAMFGVALSGPNIATWYLAWALAGLSYPFMSTTMWTLGVGRTFDRQRGLAFALTLSGVGIANMLSPLLAVSLLPVVGWRGVFVALGLVGLLFVWPLVWLLFHPERVLRERARSSAGEPPVLTGYALPHILKSVRFWSLAVVMVLLAASIGGLSIHLQPIMRDAGLSAAQAAGYAALLGPSSIAGRVFAGYLLDRFAARYVAAVLFAAPAIACAILLNYDASPVLSVITAIVLGFSAGAEGDAVAYLTAKYFGLKRYATSFAILIGLYSLGYGLSPVVVGAVFDAFGSYDSMLVVLIAGLSVSVVVAICLGRPPEFDPVDAAAKAVPVEGAGQRPQGNSALG